MLMNNLDPEVAERPDDLVVYGGTGRAARSWAAFDAIVRELRALADDETLLVASGKPVAVFRTHEWAPRVLIANSNLVGRWATWETFRELERAGLTMYGQMTAGSWIYIGSQGILQGTYETFAELARQHFGGTPARAHRAHRRPRRHGRRAAAGGDHERRRGPLHRGRPGARAAAPRDALRGPHQPTTSTRPWRWAREAAAAGARRVHRARRQRRRAGARAGAPRRALRRRHRPDLRARRAQRLRPGRPVAARRPRPAARRPRRLRAPRHGLDGRPRARHAGAPGSRRHHLRLRQQHPRPGAGRRRRRRLRHPGLRAGLHPAAVLRGPRALPLGGPVRRPGRHRPHRRGRPRPLPGRRLAAPLDPRAPRSASPTRACRRASAGSATGSARGPAWPSTSSSAAAP